ncbi:hypothetical protein [Streptomyces sp. UG1]|uniref:hypothetical protein n=1 Tax=Streptomyces sp. UG1 TaxID=3417652 RepID=UPI003CE7CADD
MTGAPPICRACDVPIEDADDAVYVGHEPSNSGPGWAIWAHRAHVDLLEPDQAATRILARVLVARALSGE